MCNFTWHGKTVARKWWCWSSQTIRQQIGFDDNVHDDSFQTSVHKFVDNTRIFRCPRVAAVDEEQNVTRKTHFLCPQTVTRKELRSWPAACCISSYPQNCIRGGEETDMHSARSGVDVTDTDKFRALVYEISLFILLIVLRN